MGFFDYMFDSEWRQRDDINKVSQQASYLSSDVANVDAHVRQLSAAVIELSATVRVLVRKLAESGQLDLEQLKTDVSKEIKRPMASPTAPQQTSVKCVRCGSAGAFDQMVKVGADIWCRQCARNP